jgi:hypothetical protein
MPCLPISSLRLTRDGPNNWNMWYEGIPQWSLPLDISTVPIRKWELAILFIIIIITTTIIIWLRLHNYLYRHRIHYILLRISTSSGVNKFTFAFSSPAALPYIGGDGLHRLRGVGVQVSVR